MPNINYINDIPDGPHNPSADQPDMKINTNAVDTIFAVDHYSFKNNNGGLHKQSTYPILLAAPTTAVLQGAVYTKDIGGGVSQLFYRRENNGVEIQLTAADSVFNAPTIVTGTGLAISAAFTNIALLPANVYGYIIMYRSSSPRFAQMGQFFTDATRCYGSSNRLVTNGSSDDDPVELNNASTTLDLQGKRDDFGAVTIDFKIHYWSK